MSLKLVSMCFDLKLTRTQRDVLMVLCDAAEDVPDNDGIGINCYPSVPRIAWRSDISRRWVSTTLRELEELKVLIPRGVHPTYYTTEFEINLTLIPRKAPFKPSKRRGGGRKL